MIKKISNDGSAMLTQHNSFHLAKTVSCAVLDKTLPSNINRRKNDIIIIISKIYMINMKHRKNCECCPRHSLFKGHNVIVNIVRNVISVSSVKSQVTRIDL